MMPLRLSTAALRWTFIVTILASSAQTLIAANGRSSPSHAVDALAALEIAAILVFALGRSRHWAALILLLVFAFAFVASAVQGEFAARFVYFAASAVFLSRPDRPRQPMEPSFG